MNHCPKCQKELQQQGEQCPHCGIFFAKYAKYHGGLSEPPPSRVRIYESNDSPTENLWHDLLFEDVHQDKQVYFIGRAIIFIGLIIWSFRLITAGIDGNAVGDSFLHLINLPFHEAGHIFFRPFGQYITSLGGTLGQLLMPLICMGTLLLKTRDPFGASVALWWLGENFLDIAPYMNDARAGDLPLVGGNFGHSSPYGFHDWEYLLTEIDLIEYDHTFAKITFTIGVLIILLSFVWSACLLLKQYQNR
jgi:hypothetical protein